MLTRYRVNICTCHTGWYKYSCWIVEYRFYEYYRDLLTVQNRSLTSKLRLRHPWIYY